MWAATDTRAPPAIPTRSQAAACASAEALSQAPYTKASVASLLTGRFPSVHGALGIADPIAREAVLLPQVLQHNGYVTGGFYLNTNVHALFGFDRGFDFYLHQATTTCASAASTRASRRRSRSLPSTTARSPRPC
ncbi:MAG: sulfatase-like hydrolase/transferase [Planctomycetota bacterium]